MYHRKCVIGGAVKRLPRMCVDLRPHAVATPSHGEPEFSEPLIVEHKAPKMREMLRMHDRRDDGWISPRSNPEHLTFGTTRTALAELRERFGKHCLRDLEDGATHRRLARSNGPTRRFRVGAIHAATQVTGRRRAQLVTL